MMANMANKQRFRANRPNKTNSIYQSSTDIVVFSAETPFSGERLHTQYLLAQIKQMGMAHADAQMLRDYMSEIFPLNDLGKPIFPEDYQLLPIPAVPSSSSDPNASVTLRIIAATQERNRRITLAKTALYGIICKVCHTKFASTFAQYAEEPYNILRYIRKHFGADSMGYVEICAAWYQFMYYQFDSREPLTMGLLKYKQLIYALEVSVAQQLAMLRQLKENGGAVQLIPERLESALKFAIDQDYGLQKTWTYLLRKDSEQQATFSISNRRSPNHPESKRPQVAAIRNSKAFSPQVCYNCGEKGHVSSQCPVEECGRCGEHGHHTGECPQRNQSPIKPKGKNNSVSNPNGKAKSSKGNKKGTNTKDAPSDEDDEEEPKRKKDIKLKKVKQIQAENDDKLDVLLNKISSLESQLKDARVNQASAKRLSQLSYDSDVEEDYLGDGYDIHAFNKLLSKRKRGKLVEVVRVIRSGQLTFYILKFDSGADVHITCSTNGMFNIEYYDEANPCPLGVETADGSPLRIIARGDLNQYLRGVYVCEDVEGTLVSLQELQNVGLGITFPPLDILQPFGSTVGGFVHESNGAIIGVLNRQYEMPLQGLYKTGYYLRWSSEMDSILITDSRNHPISPSEFMSARIRNVNRWRRAQLPAPRSEDAIRTGWQTTQARWFVSQAIYHARRIPPPVEHLRAVVSHIYGYGLDCVRNIKQLVYLLQCTFMCSKKVLLWMAGNILNFPATPDQIRRFYVDLEAFILSHMRMRNKRESQFVIESSIKDSDLREQKTKTSKKTKAPLPQVPIDSTEELFPGDPRRALQPMYNRPGYRVCADLKNHEKAWLLVLRDAATGACKSYVLPNGKKGAPRALERFFILLKSKGHKLRELITDAESIFTAQEDLVHQYDAVLLQSPPYEHHINGMIERMIGVIQSITLGFMLNANWLSSVFWAPLWQQAERTLLWRRSMIDGDTRTRMEAFFQVTPDFKKIIMLPPGALVAFRIGDPKSEPGSVKKKAGIGFYLGPAEGINGGIIVYSLATRRLRVGRTWRLLQNIPQFLMRYDHSKLFNGEAPKYSDLTPDIQPLEGVPTEDNADEIYDTNEDMQFDEFAVRPDPLYTEHEDAILHQPTDIDPSNSSEGIDPASLNPLPSGNDESSPQDTSSSSENMATSSSFFTAAASSEGESVFRVSRTGGYTKHPIATVLNSEYFTGGAFKRVRVNMLKASLVKPPFSQSGIRLSRHSCYSDETGYMHINNLMETRTMWREEGIRNDPLSDYSESAFQQLVSSVEFDYMVKQVQERSDAIKADSINFDDLKIYKWYTLGQRGYPNADTIRGFITDSIQHDLDSIAESYMRCYKIDDPAFPAVSHFMQDSPQIPILENIKGQLDAIKMNPKARTIPDPPVVPITPHVARSISSSPHAIIQAIPVVDPGHDIDPIIYDHGIEWPNPFRMNDPNNVPNLDIDIYYPYLRRVNHSVSPVAIGISLLEGAGRGLFATRDICKGETLGVYDGPQDSDSGILTERGRLENGGEHSRGIYDSGIEGPYRYTLSDQRSYPYFANDPLGRPDLVNSHLVWDSRRHRGVLQSTDEITRGDEIFYAYGSEFWREFRYDLEDPFDYSMYLSYGVVPDAWYPVPDFL